MAIYARRNLIFTEFGPNVLLTQPLAEGQTLVYDRHKGSFVNEDAQQLASAVIVVADIPARDALIPNLITGQMVFVQNAGAPSNTYALYMWNGSSFTLISTQNSADSDANTVNFILYYNSPAINLMGAVSPGHRAFDITVSVITPFNGTAPLLTIGDDEFGPLSLMTAAQNDLSMGSDYISDGTFVYGGTEDVDFSAYYTANGSTQGEAEIIVSYV